MKEEHRTPLRARVVLVYCEDRKTRKRDPMHRRQTSRAAAVMREWLEKAADEVEAYGDNCEAEVF
jgi:hypothetical protein